MIQKLTLSVPKYSLNSIFFPFETGGMLHPSRYDI